MSDLLTSAAMRAADEQTIAAGTPSQVLMERAAQAALEVLQKEFDTTRVLFLCGGGNNGGDGLAMARFFAEQGGDARVLYVGTLTTDEQPDTNAMSTECARQYALLPAHIPVDTVWRAESVTAVVDAMLGIGLSRPVEGRIREVIRTAADSGLPVLAIDIPSGVHADTGAVLGAALPAAHTVAIAALKFGHLLYPATTLCGRITVVDIGVHAKKAMGHLMEKSDLSSLPPRRPNAHKGTFGRVLIIGGSVGMSGAGYLAAKAALRAGAGLVEIFAPTENRVIYQTQLPEALLTLYDPQHFDATLLLSAIARADAIAIGMGLSQNDFAGSAVTCVLSHATVPVVADADALNLLARIPAPLAFPKKRSFPLILTPHLMEASRLFGLSVPELAADLPGHTRRLAQACGGTLVMKDARTLVSDGEQLFLNAFGNSGMATGGSGDVLAGVIASFAAQGASPTDAARLGVLAHALAGDAARELHGNHGLMASDIIDGLCSVLE